MDYFFDHVLPAISKDFLIFHVDHVETPSGPLPSSQALKVAFLLKRAVLRSQHEGPWEKNIT